MAIKRGTMGDGILDQYSMYLFEVMEQVGLQESVEQKILTAVIVQFLATFVIFIMPPLFVGPQTVLEQFPLSMMILTGLVFAVAVVWIINTLIIVRKDIIEPLGALQEAVEGVEEGDLETDLEDTDREDEIGDLQRAFVAMYDHLNLISAQAKAIGKEEFDADVLEESVPGELGAALDNMRIAIVARVRRMENEQDKIKEERAAIEQRNEALQEDAEQIRDVLQQAAEGDFTVRAEIESEEEAMEAIVGALNQMLDDIEETIGAVQDLALEVDAIGDDVSESVEEIEQASGEVSRSAEEISAATAEQTERFQEVFSEMNDLSATVEEIAATTDDVADTSKSAADRAMAGSESATEAIEELDRLETRTDEVVDEIVALADELGQIGEIVEVIDDIAEETNLLALNASIEAARAGEAGEGFAVVANEVKNLAEETAKATQDVDQLITQIESSADEAVADIKGMQTDVTEGVDTVEESLSALEEIATAVKQANESIQSIDEATDEQAATTQQVVEMVDQAAEDSERTESEAESVAAAAEEQTATVSEVSQASQGLSKQATDLANLVEDFTVGAAGDGEIVTQAGGPDPA